jgi:fumarate reductase (CoM/CoB) subunit A
MIAGPWNGGVVLADDCTWRAQLCAHPHWPPRPTDGYQASWAAMGRPTSTRDLLGTAVRRALVTTCWTRLLATIAGGYARSQMRLPDMCDVLVLGGGLAGLRAAFAARTSGAAVVLLSKKEAGRSGASAVSSGGYAACYGTTDDAPEVHFRDTVRSGAALSDPTLARTLAFESADRLDELLALGLELERSEGIHVRQRDAGHTRPRTLLAEHAAAWPISLAETCRRMGVVIESPAAATKLIVHGERGPLPSRRVIGSAFLRPDGTTGVVLAGATVLATGGALSLFSGPTIPRDLTGDGLILAIEAGAILRDMEFIQFYPWHVIRPRARGRIVVPHDVFEEGARLLNSRQDRFMLKFDAEHMELATRDIASIAIAEQVRTGLGVEGGVRLELATRHGILGEAAAAFVRDVREAAGGVWTGEVIVAPEAHFMMGGVLIDAHGATSIAGLYAAGEVAGGLHGANRLANNAIPETQVFGRRAGNAAARFSRLNPLLPGDIRHHGSGPLPAHPDQPTYHDHSRAKLSKSVISALGPIRDREQLETALVEVRDLSGMCPESRSREQVCGLRIQARVAEACLVPALLRSESRGAHYRLDYRSLDPRQGRPILVHQRDGVLMGEFAEGMP